MPRRLISELTDHEAIDQVFLLSEKQLRANRNGNLYLQLRLTDRSGAISAMMWNATERTAGLAESGDYVQVQGTSQVYNGTMQVIATRIERVDPAQIDE